MFPARFIFGVLCIIQVQRVDFTNQEGFNTGLVTLLCYSVRFFGYCQLLCLVIEMLYQQENILVEIDLFLPDFRKHYIPVAFRYPYLSTSLSPVQNRNLNTSLHCPRLSPVYPTLANKLMLRRLPRAVATA